MILKLLLLCSLFFFSTSQEDDDAGQETTEENSANQTNSSVVDSKRGNQGVGRSAKGQRSSWSSWCYYNGCPADHYGNVNPQCCHHSHYCRQTASCRNQISWWNYYAAMVQQRWVWCEATQSYKNMLQMQQPRVVNKKLLALGAGSVTFCQKNYYGAWEAVTNNVAVGQLDADQIGQIERANCGYVAHEEGQVTPTCADLARYCTGRRVAWVTIASWDLKWCRGTIRNQYWMLERNGGYGGCCWNSFYKERASQCSWTRST